MIKTPLSRPSEQAALRLGSAKLGSIQFGFMGLDQFRVDIYKQIARKKILITGGKGFIGKILSERLDSLGADVSAIAFDIRNRRETDELTGVDIVYHLAAAVPQKRGISEDPDLIYSVNVDGTHNILEMARRNNAKFIFASSYIYGPPRYLPIDEEHPANPKSPYGKSKYLGEALCRAYHRDYNLTVLIMRAFNVYGGKQEPGFLIPDLLRQVEKKKKITVSNPNSKRDFIYVDDIVDAYIRLALYEPINGFDIFNIGSGVSHSVKEVVEKIVSICGNEINVEYSNTRQPDSVTITLADIKKANELLKWHPIVSMDEGLRVCMEKSG